MNTKNSEVETASIPKTAPQLNGTIPSETIRHLCLATAAVGAIYWLALIREYPAGLLLILTSAWIVARTLGALRSQLAAITVSLAFLLVLTMTALPAPPPLQHALAEALPFSHRAYLYMLAALIVADGLDLAQLCFHFRQIRRGWLWHTGQVESSRATI